MLRRKSLETASLFLPVFVDQGQDISGGFEIKFSDICDGKCLYGDSSKSVGLRLAVAWAMKNKKTVKVVEIKVRISNTTQYGAVRMDRETFEGSDYNLLRLDMVKNIFRDELSDMITKAGVAKHQNLRTRTAEEWLIRDPSLGRVIFDEFPQAETVVIAAKTPYSEDQVLNVALLRSPANIIGSFVIHNPDVPVSIV